MKILFAVIFTLAFGRLGSALEWDRTVAWVEYRETSGRSFRGLVQDVYGDQVDMLIARGGRYQRVDIPLRRFSWESQQKLRYQWREVQELREREKREEAFLETDISVLSEELFALNDAVGWNLFDASGLADDIMDDVWRRLNLNLLSEYTISNLASRIFYAPPVGEVEKHKSFRDAKYQIFGAEPVYVFVYSHQDTPFIRRLRILYSNKFTFDGGRRSNSDYRTVSRKLDEVARKIPMKDQGLKPNRLEMWRSDLVTFVLGHCQNEYLSLDIFPGTESDYAPYAEPVAGPLRRDVGDNGEFGEDVFLIAEMPRQGVDACAPNAAAMALAFSGLPASPQLIANLAGTNLGREGTQVSQLVQACETIFDTCESGGLQNPFHAMDREIAYERGAKLRFRDIAEHIDQGRLLVVGEQASPELTKYLTENEQLRGKQLSRNEARFIRSLLRDARSAAGEPHLIVIAGYNEELEEVLIVDPNGFYGWGAMDVLDKVYNGYYFVVE